uniref:Retrotransposon gag domain-containing protein n=1 Tax=Brassica oleracea var. oleracea TaxID=109376 RepID=A0A0D2ZTT2_BRAOL
MRNPLFDSDSHPDFYVDTPFTDEITLIEMPMKFSFPSIKAYDGTTDPDDHVAQYRQRMLAIALPKRSREATMCKGFGSALTEPALQWYINLPSRSIASFAVLSDKFVEQFASSRDLEKISDSLYEILQHRAEPLRGYIARFNQEKVAIPECSIPTAISAFKRGMLPDGDLYKELTKYQCKTMEAVISRAWAQVKWEEDVASRAKEQQKQDPKTIRPNRTERDEKPSQRQARDSGNRNRGRYQNRPIKKAEGMAVSTWPDISHLSISRPELINALRQMGQQVKWPQKMKAPVSFRNPGFWCDFHRDHSHETEDYVALKIEVNKLLKKRHLREFLSEKAKSHLSKETTGKPTEAAPVSPPRQDRIIHVISGDFDRQRNAQKARLVTADLKRKSSPIYKITHDEYMPSSTISNKETQLLFSPDHASLERSIRKEVCSISIDNNTCSSLDFFQPPSTHTLVPSTDTRSPPSTKDTHLPSTDIEGHLRNAAGQKIDAQGAAIPESDANATGTTLLYQRQGFRVEALGSDSSLIRETVHTSSGNQARNRNSYGNRGNFNQSLQYKKPYSNNKNYKNSYYQKPPLPTQESKIEEMLDRVLEAQQRMAVDFNGKIDSVYTNLNTKSETLSTHVKKPEMQVVQIRDAVKRREASTRGVGDDVMKHHVNAIIEDDFWQVVKEEKLQEGDFEVQRMMSFGGSHWCLSTSDFEHRSTHTSPNRSTGSPEHRPMTPTKSTASCNAVRILTHEEFAEKHPHPPNPDNVRITRRDVTPIDRQQDVDIDRQQDVDIDRQHPAPIDRRAPITYQVQMPMIDVAHLNALRPKPKPSENSPETVRVTREKEEDIKRMFCEDREKMRMRITLKKKSDPEKFAISCTVKGIEFPHALCDTGASLSILLPRVMAYHLGLQIGNALVPVDFHVLDIKLNWNSSLLLGRAFLSTVGAVCNLKTIQMCLTLIDSNAHYDPIPVKKPYMSSRRINDPGIIPACHYGVEYEIEYSASIETHTTTSIDSANQKSTDNPHDESEDTLLHHSSWKRNAPSIDIPGSPSIDTQPHQRNRKRASTDIANYSSIDAEVNRVREGDYSIGIWTDDHHHESDVVETTIYEPGADELHEGFTYEELLNMQRRDETAQHQSETVWGRIRYMHPIDRARRPSIDITPSISIDLAHTTSIYRRMYPDGHARSIDGCILNVSRKDIADILQTANGADNLFVHNRNIPEYQQKDKKEFYDAAGGIDKSFKLRFYWEEKDQYGVYRDDQGCARYMDGHIINVSKEEIRKLMERASRDEPSYICLPEHASSFSQIKLVPEIYTKDEINEMFYGVVGEQEKNKEVLQMKLDGVYYPLNDSTSWLTTCMEEMKQDIARIQHATDVARSSSIDGYQQTSIDVRQRTSIDNQMQTSVDDNPPRPHTMKSQHNFHTREEIDQLVEGIYRALENIEDRLDGRCDDIYFPMDLNISALTSKIEAIKRELVEIHSYIARRPEASSSIDRRNNKSTDIHHRSSADDATNRGRLVPKMTSDMSDTHYHGEEISADTYAKLTRHQFNLEGLGDRLQRIENTTGTMKEKWRRGMKL